MTRRLTPNERATRKAQRFADKLNSHYLVSGDGCWEWKGAPSDRGYGAIAGIGAHVASYVLHRGPIPDGLVLDHLCRNRICINPDHLEPVSNRENVLRGEGPTALNARKTHCKWGHEFNEDNSYLSSRGDRVCLPCSRIRRKRVRDQGYWARVRSWARANGMEVGKQGPLPDRVIAAYREAEPTDTYLAAKSGLGNASEESEA